MNSVKIHIEVNPDLLEGLLMTNVNGRYTIVSNNRAFNIGETLYFILAELKEGKSWEGIYESVKTKYADIDIPTFNEIVETNVKGIFDKLASPSSTQTNKSSYIYGQIPLFNSKGILRFSKHLHFLFNRYILGFSFAATVLLALYYYKGVEIPATGTGGLSLTYTIFAYFCIISVMIFHEIGHAAAASYYDIPPKGIGFGFYLIFPVLFTDITAIWALDKYKRVLINFAGVYFQLLVQGLLYLALIFFRGGGNETIIEVLNFISRVNLFVAIYSLMPFFRNDGYWIYSDLFDLPNLMKRAYNYPTYLYQLLKKNKDHWTLSLNQIKQQFPLALFSIANYIFISSFIYMYSQFFYKATLQVYSILFDKNPCYDCFENSIGQIIISYLLLSFMLYRYRKSIVGFFQKMKGSLIRKSI